MREVKNIACWAVQQADADIMCVSHPEIFMSCLHQTKVMLSTTVYSGKVVTVSVILST